MSPVASTRWCPTAEQIMILEEMYRGGIRTPNASQIQHITAHLSLYGKIEGKNVFYWFQNHKARDRQKLRKRLLGKQLHLQQPQPQPQQQQQQHQQQKQTTLHAQLPNNVSIVDELSSNFQQHPPNYHNFRHQLHFDETPLPPPRYPLTPPSLAGLHQLHNFNNSPPSRVANHQARTHSYTWKLETIEANNGREKSRPIRITHDDDWIMIGDHDEDNDDGRGHEMSGGTTTRPLKTLQLFPIKEKTSLKEQHHLSPPSHFHAYF